MTSPGKEEPTNNGWEELLVELDLVVAEVVDPTLWQALEPWVVTWLRKNVIKFSWFNILVLNAAVYTRSGSTCTHSFLISHHSFLRWAIPDHYPNLRTFKPEEALETYFGAPPHPRGVYAFKVYFSFQRHLQHYLTSLPEQERLALAPYQLPTLKPTPQLYQLRRIAEEQSRRARKKQAFAVVNRLPQLVALARQRYRWLADLENQVQNVAQAVETGEMTLPVQLKVLGLNGDQEVTFRVWDRVSWVQHHRKAYPKSALNVTLALQGPPYYTGLFVQLVGDLPAQSWFLRAIALGALQGPQRLAEAAQTYLQQVQAPNLSFAYVPGLLAAPMSRGRVYFARRKAAGTPEDSTILFCVEPLLAAATVGLFTLISLVSTGMRLGELQQVTLDPDCMEYSQLPQFDDRTQQWISGPKRLYWKLYPKGATERERYIIPSQVTEAMFIMLDLHRRYYGPDSLQPITTNHNGFTHHRRFTDQHKFVLQWDGRHLPTATLNQCLAFVLLEHGCRDEDGQPVNITSHVLRHAVAGWLRSQGIPLEDLMTLLKQVNIGMTDYYSKSSPQELYRRLGPALTALADLTGTDPSTIRTVGDIQTLTQDALKRYGVLRQTPGGTCAVFTPCEVQFKCASCPAYIPEPTRQHEVQEKINSHQQAIQLFDELGDHLQADVQKAYLRDWQRIEQEMRALTQVELVSPPADQALSELMMDDLGEQLQDSLNQLPELSSGGNDSDDQ